MAIYDYLCPSHGIFEISRSMFDTGPQKCPKCDKTGKRAFFAAPAIYKTDGFYHIDSGRRFESQLTPKGKEIYEKAKAEV